MAWKVYYYSPFAENSDDSFCTVVIFFFVHMSSLSSYQAPEKQRMYCGSLLLLFPDGEKELCWLGNPLLLKEWG